MQLNWTSSSLELDAVRPETLKAEGVYIIYQAGNPPRSVYVGKGHIGKRLTALKTDKRFDKIRSTGKLLVTYAAVPAQDQEGVEKYLARLLAPSVEERRPDTREIAVNTPFAA
jgi:hypothetical protein